MSHYGRIKADLIWEEEVTLTNVMEVVTLTNIIEVVTLTNVI
jgi:hypothetical protein